LSFAAMTAIHLMSAMYAVAAGRSPLSIVPNKKDFTDAIQTLTYYLGRTDTPAQFDRFDYRQKFEYWGLVLGAVVVIGTGLVLYFPILFTRFFPGELIPAAKVAHSNEGLMAFLVVILWHIYNAHFNPDVFPFDKTIFTGKISRERMHHEHPLELARLEQTQDSKEH
jgi:cytochrome b subunit of formate dehydrogenase